MTVPSRQYVIDLLASPPLTDDCVDWPFGLSSGYGTIGSERIHVTVCESVNGPRPPGHDAAHRCERRVCVNHRHLEWQPRQQNAADGISKATPEMVTEMRRLHAEGWTNQEIGDRFGLHNSTVSRQRRGVYQHRTLDQGDDE